MKEVFTDNLILSFSVRQVCNEVNLSWDTYQIEWHHGRDKTEKFHKITNLRLVSEVFDKLSGFFRQLLNFSLAYMN